MTAQVSPAMRQAIEIAVQFRHIPPDEAIAAITEHIHNFWDPRIRTQLIAEVSQAGGRCDAQIAAVAAHLRCG